MALKQRSNANTHIDKEVDILEAMSLSNLQFLRLPYDRQNNYSGRIVRASAKALLKPSPNERRIR